MWSKNKDISEASLLAKAAHKSEEEAAAIFESELLKAFKKRFEHSLPLHSVNLIFIESAAMPSIVS